MSTDDIATFNNDMYTMCVAFNCVAHISQWPFCRVCVYVSLPPFHKSLFLFVIFKLKKNNNKLIRQVRSHANQLIKYNKSSKIYWQNYGKKTLLACMESIVAREWLRKR